jgi:predicted dehydrogenase
LLHSIQQSEVAEAVAVAGRSEQKARALAGKHDVPVAFGDFDSLVSCPEVDVVYNATPNHWHRPWTLKALAAGKHVLCEKPIALDAREAEEMFAAADRDGLHLMEAFAFRCHPQTDKIRELVQSGELGTVAVVRASYSFHFSEPENVRWDPTMGGGALYDIGCYCINLARWALGSEPTEVTALATFTKKGVDETTAAALRFPGGVLAILDCSFRGSFRVSAEIVGTKARLHVQSPWKPMSHKPLLLWRGDDVQEIPVDGADAYQLQVDHFSRCVRGEEVPRVSPEDSIANMKVIDEIRKAAMRDAKC